MVSLKSLVALSIILSAVMTVIALLNKSWMWAIISIVCVAMLSIPNVKDLGYTYNRHLVAMTIVAPICGIIVGVLQNLTYLDSLELWEVTGYTYLAAAVQAYQCFMLGFMLALVMDRSYGLTMTNAWLAVFALTFAMSISALDIFFTCAELYFQGYPVFNEDFVDGDIYTNNILMATPLSYFIVTLILVVYVEYRLRGKNKAAFLVMGETA